jgi:hypothetical protein
MEGHKKKKPTKAQLINEIIPQQFEQKLKETHIKGLVQGFEIANTMIMEYAKENNIEQVIEFCKKNIEQKETMAKVVEKGVN